MTKSLQVKEFWTTDLALSSALLCLGHRLNHIEKASPKASFVFQESVQLGRDVSTFWAGDLRVEPKQYFNCLKEIKSRLYGN